MMPLIQVSQVSVQRGAATVLQEASLTLAFGDRLAIIGPNGTGKTTLLRTIVGLERPTAGTVTLFGHECRSEKAFRDYRPRIGFLFQDSDDQLFCPTVLQDVCFGPLNIGQTESDAIEIADKTLSDLGIGHLRDRVTTALSGGEKRLVCLAGLLAMQPDVLILDEPTNGVDSENTARMRTALAAFRGAMILVSHDDNFIIDQANRAMVLRNGTLTEAQIQTHPHLHSHPHVHPHA